VTGRRRPAADPIAILGGTFDPVHWGHLAIGETAREALGVSRVVFVPAGSPPHKAAGSFSRAEHRVAMLEAAVADNPAFAVSRTEVDRRGPSYTADTLAELSARAGDAPTWFILSHEALAGLPTWHRPERVLELACLAVVPRAGRESLPVGWVAEHFPGRESRFRFLDGPAIDVSASDIRARARDGRSIRYLVPPAVEAYIAHHDLYRTDPHERRP
jgi:nicotinate-nucleotide adenylyltransferase